LKIDIAEIHNRGDYDKEYVTLKVATNCDAGRHVLADTTYAEDHKVSSLLRHVYWLPDKDVSPGDLIHVYTKMGKNRSFANQSKTNTHEFYWGSRRRSGTMMVILQFSLRLLPGSTKG